MEKNKYVVELIIDTGNDIPDIVTDNIGLQPTKIFRKGEQWLRPTDKQPIAGKFYESNLWIYNIKKIYDKESLYLNDAISELLENFNKNSEELKEILIKYPTNRLNCVAYFNENNPFFQIDTKLITKLNYYSLKLTFDFYFTAEQ